MRRSRVPVLFLALLVLGITACSGETKPKKTTAASQTPTADQQVAAALRKAQDELRLCLRIRQSGFPVDADNAVRLLLRDNPKLGPARVQATTKVCGIEENGTYLTEFSVTEGEGVFIGVAPGTEVWVVSATKNLVFGKGWCRVDPANDLVVFTDGWVNVRAAQVVATPDRLGKASAPSTLLTDYGPVLNHGEWCTKE